MDSKTLLAVLIAGIGATLIDNLAAMALFGLDFIALTVDRPGRFVIGIAGAALLPFIFAALKGASGLIVGLVVLAGGAAALAKGVFGYAAPLPNVLLLTTIYAVSAIVIFGMVRGRVN
ncbi:MAG: hypothetical protein KTR21_00570 [Rhodobacteraceae bacterium]|nr:hypothetical protein [Paracoccaceae bacterium]